MEKKIQTIREWLGQGSINLFGRPFAGKDTQCENLAKLFDAPVMGGGHILRSTRIPEHIKKVMEAGELIPVEDYLTIFTPYLSKPEFDGKPLILSSVGKSHGEEPGILQGTADAGHPLKAAIYINISEEVVRQRWAALHVDDKRGMRADDHHASLEIRFKEFANKTLPVIDFYRDRGLLVEVDGTATPEKVAADILDKLYELSQSTARTAV